MLLRFSEAEDYQVGHFIELEGNGLDERLPAIIVATSPRAPFSGHYPPTFLFAKKFPPPYHAPKII